MSFRGLPYIGCHQALHVQTRKAFDVSPLATVMFDSPRYKTNVQPGVDIVNLLTHRLDISDFPYIFSHFP